MTSPSTHATESAHASEDARAATAGAEGFVSRVGRSVVWTQMLRIIETGTSLLFLVAVVRKLGPAEYGIFNVIVSVTAACNMLSVLGFSEALSKYVPELAGKGTGDATAWIAQRILAIGILLALLCCLFVWVFRGYIAGVLHYPGLSGLYPVIAVLVVSQTASTLLSALNIGLWRAGIVFTITGLVNVVSVIGAVWLVWTGRATGQSAALAAAIAFMLGMAAFTAVSRQWLFARPRLVVDMRPIWRFAASAWLVRLSLFAMSSNVVVILMSWLIGDQREIAYFSCAYVPMLRLQALISGWSVSVLPSLSELKATAGASGLVLPYRLYIKLAVATATPAFLFVGWHADSLVASLFGQRFLPAVPSLRVYACLSLAAVLAGSSLTTMLLYSLGRARLVGVTRACVAAAHLIVSCMLILRYGATGAVAGIGLAAITAACLEITMAPASIRARYPIGFIAKSLMVAVGCIAVTSLLRPTTVFGLAAAGVVSFAAYSFLLARLKPLDDEERRVLERHPAMTRILAALRI